MFPLASFYFSADSDEHSFEDGVFSLPAELADRAHVAAYRAAKPGWNKCNLGYSFFIRQKADGTRHAIVGLVLEEDSPKRKLYYPTAHKCQSASKLGSDASFEPLGLIFNRDSFHCWMKRGAQTTAAKIDLLQARLIGAYRRRVTDLPLSGRSWNSWWPPAASAATPWAIASADIIVASGQAPRSQAEHMTAPSSLVQPEKDLAARAVPHMSQSQFCMPNDTSPARSIRSARRKPTVRAS